jgi:acetylornithine/N-succinyldiaminopimelate aminotransferase
MAAIFAAKQEKLVKGFGPPMDGFDLVPFGDVAAVRAAIGPETAGICIEPIQGEGGIRVASPEFLRELRAICDESGLLLFLDEIQCGMGRTGKLFAHEWAGITPDIMCVAKGIGGGFPLGACLATERAAVGMTAGSHGSTYGGNLLAMAVGDAVLDIVLQPGFMESVSRVGARLKDGLTDLAATHPKVFSEVRGYGLMLGLRAVPPMAELIARLRDNGLLTVPAGDNVVRLLPPLIVGDEHVDEALEILDRTAREVTP